VLQRLQKFTAEIYSNLLLKYTADLVELLEALRFVASDTV
jgi:hypothetical protein